MTSRRRARALGFLSLSAFGLGSTLMTSTSAEPVDVASTGSGTAEVAAPVTSRWANQLYQRVQSSIVLVKTENSEGTGFLFHSQRHIATAFHVVEAGRTLRVSTSGGRELQARVIAWDTEWDLALLELSEPLDAPLLRPVRSGEGQVGDPVVTVGNPWGGEQRKLPGSSAPVWALSQGVVSAPPGEMIQTDAAVNPGNSGGPLLTQQGEVVGVLVVRVAGSDGISFAVSSQRLLALTETIGKQGEYRKPWVRTDFQLSWVPVAEHSLSGVLFGPRLVFGDRWGLSARAARLWGDTEVVSTLHQRERNRWLLETDLSLHVGSGQGSGAFIGVGLALQRDQIVDARIDLAGTELSEERSRRDQDRLRAMLSLGLGAEWILIDTTLYAWGGDGFGARFGLGLLF